MYLGMKKQLMSYKTNIFCRYSSLKILAVAWAMPAFLPRLSTKSIHFYFRHRLFKMVLSKFCPVDKAYRLKFFIK